MSDLFKSEFFTDEATVYNLKDSMWLGKPSKSNEWWFGVQNTDATDDERNKAALYIANAINQHEKLVFSLDDRDCYIADADMKNAELIARNAELEAALEKIIKLDESRHCFEDGETQICNIAANALEHS